MKFSWRIGQVTLFICCTGQAMAADWLETRIAIEDLIAVADYPAAFALTDDLLDSASAEFGQISIQAAESQLLSADVLLGQGEYVNAQIRILEAIELYKQIDGPTTEKLTDPLIRLGKAYRDSGEYELSIDTLDYARMPGRRADGLLNLQQIPILEEMAATALASGDFARAREWREEGRILALRSYGEESPEFFDESLRHAEWLMHHAHEAFVVSSYHELQAIFRAMQQRFDDHVAEDPEREIRMLQANARSKRMFGAMLEASSPEELAANEPDDLERALAILEQMDDPDPLLRATLMRDLGDWNTAMQRFNAVEPAYAEAWRLLDNVAGGDSLQQEWFAAPLIVRRQPMTLVSTCCLPAETKGHVSFEFTVDPLGRVAILSVQSAEPAGGSIERQAVERLRQSSFRPRMENGQLVSAWTKLTWNFHYDSAFVRGVDRLQR